MQSRRAHRGQLVQIKITDKLLIQCRIPDQTATATSMVDMAQTVEAEGREILAMVHKIKSSNTEK